MALIAVNMSDEFQRLIVQTGESDRNPAKTEKDVIRRAVALYTYLHNQLEKYPAAKVCISGEDGKIIQIIDPLP